MPVGGLAHINLLLSAGLISVHIGAVGLPFFEQAFTIAPTRAAASDHQIAIPPRHAESL